jgi:hypothetical protein
MDSPQSPRSPRTPPPASRGTKRQRSPSPTTPSPRQREQDAPSAPTRRRRLTRPDLGEAQAQNLLSRFEEQARLQKEAEEFHAEQDGLEQQVPTGEAEEIPVGDIILPSIISFAWFYGDWDEEQPESDDAEDAEDDF